MDKYIYCTVQPKDMHSVYYYLGDEHIKINTYVEIPFGSNDEIRKGIVLDVKEVTAEEAPYPPESTKRILNMIDKDIFDEEDDLIPFIRIDEYEDDEIAEVDEYIRDEDYDAIFEWAYNHHDETDSKIIIQKVKECYEICAKQNNPLAALNLGTMYYNGRGLHQDFKKAAELYEIAAISGEKRALCNLGYCYYYGRHQEKDYNKAYEYFNSCALLHNDANSLYKLGDMYKNGIVVDQNEKYAFMLYERAYESADPYEDEFCIPDIQMRLGECYLKSPSVESDPVTALGFLQSALVGFYKRRETDPFVGSLINGTKKMIDEAVEKIENR